MLILKQSTSIDIRMGPFVDVTDGVTPETAITLAGADQAEVLKANGAATVAMAGAFVAITGADGWYDYTVATTDVDTVGEVVFVVQDLSVCLPVYVRGYVVEEAVYDAMYGAASTGPLQGTTAGNTLDVNATGEAGLDLDNTSGTLAAAQIAAAALDGKGDWNIGKTGYSLTQAFPTNFADMAITITTGQVTVGTNNDKTGYSIASGGIVAASFGAGAIDNAAFNVTETLTANPAAGGIAAASFAANAIDANALATDAVDEIRDGLLPTQNAAFNNIPFLLVAASDHVTPVTAATGLAVTRSIDGGVFGAGTGTIAEIANGMYQYDASAADMNGGVIIFRFTATGGTPGAPDDAFVPIVTGGGV